MEALDLTEQQQGLDRQVEGGGAGASISSQ